MTDTRREDVARAQREMTAAVIEADEWLTEHRVSESWRVINRLRVTLVRTSDVLAALPAPPVVDEVEIEREALRQFPDDHYVPDRDQVRLGFEAGAAWAIARLRGATRG